MANKFNKNEVIDILITERNRCVTDTAQRESKIVGIEASILLPESTKKAHVAKHREVIARNQTRIVELDEIIQRVINL